MTLQEIFCSLPIDIGDAILIAFNTTEISSDASEEEIHEAAEFAVKQVNYLVDRLEISEKLRVRALLAQMPNAIVELLK